jgi:hypothetical protein
LTILAVIWLKYFWESGAWCRQLQKFHRDEMDLGSGMICNRKVRRINTFLTRVDLDHLNRIILFNEEEICCCCSKLKALGQRSGASGALVHLRKQSNGHVMLNVANVGDVEVVLCRRGQQLTVTRRFTTTSDREECLRVSKSDGIINEVTITHDMFGFCCELVNFFCHVSLNLYGNDRRKFRSFWKSSHKTPARQAAGRSIETEVFNSLLSARTCSGGAMRRQTGAVVLVILASVQALRWWWFTCVCFNA